MGKTTALINSEKKKTVPTITISNKRKPKKKKKSCFFPLVQVDHIVCI